MSFGQPPTEAYPAPATDDATTPVNATTTYTIGGYTAAFASHGFAFSHSTFRSAPATTITLPVCQPLRIEDGVALVALLELFPSRPPWKKYLSRLKDCIERRDEKSRKVNYSARATGSSTASTGRRRRRRAIEGLAVCVGRERGCSSRGGRCGCSCGSSSGSGSGGSRRDVRWRAHRQRDEGDRRAVGGGGPTPLGIKPDRRVDAVCSDNWPAV